MKKYICILAALMLLLALAGCGNDTPATEPSETLGIQETVGETTPVVMTEQDLLDLFASYAEDGWQVVDCVLFDESNGGISGAIHYVTPDYNGSKFDFIKDGNPLTTGVEAEPVSHNAKLNYSGNDRIVCRLKNENGEFTCVITCTVSGSEVNFNISGGEK